MNADRRLLTLEQGQKSHTESLGEIRIILAAVVRRLETVEQKIATLEAAQRASVVGSVAGYPEWTVTVAGMEMDPVGDG